jgi:hypothetical protein
VDGSLQPTRFTLSNKAACLSFASAYTLHCKVEGPCAISTRPWPTSSPSAARLRPALITALAQHFWLDDPTAQPLIFFAMWMVTAAVSAGLIWIEMQARSRRHHSGLADAMVYQAIEQFLPIGAAGALLAVMLGKFAPETLWMLPGLWQILVSLGIFASARSLPRTVTLGGAWYFVAGFACLLLASQNHALSPWSMGVPFVVGQLLMAAILHLASGGSDAED